jgi:ribonuclease R
LNREKILAVLDTAFAEGLRVADIAAELRVPKRDRHKLRNLLASMVDAGEIDRLSRGRYGVTRDRAKNKGRGEKAAPPSPMAAGQIRVHPAGYGFVERSDGLGDVFVPAKYRGTSLDGDQVRLYTWEGYKGTEGRVEEVLSRGRAKLTGTLVRAGRSVHLEPDDPRIATDFGRVSLLPGGPVGRPGECVVAEIVDYPTEAKTQLRARVLRVLGPPEDPDTEIEKIIACGDIPAEFPAGALAQAEATPDVVTEADRADRIDLRDRPFLTIDPETARDFDDALCIEDRPGGGVRVWVAVADVSHYVRADDALDREAQIRGVSVYLPDRVIPMLPQKLSAEICSLNPEVDRCAMVAHLDFHRDGTPIDAGFCAAVIRSHARLDYPGVAAALSGDFRGPRAHYKKWAEALAELDRLAKKLRARRRARGTLELDVPEAKVVLDADDPKLVRDVVMAKGDPAVRGAYELVEEFMIAANEAVGDFFEDRGLTAIWRIHAEPDRDRLGELAEILDNFGIAVDVEASTSPAGLQKVLADIEGHPAARALGFQVLRSLKQAQYSTKNVGHFGLASDRYIHFTSPIRRYPDLAVHRLLKATLHREGQASGGFSARPPAEPNELDRIAVACSSFERRAVEAEREAVAMYRALIMKDQIGESFDGRVSAVAHFGVFVEIEEPFVEGLIKTELLGDDTFEFDAASMSLSGRRSGFTIGVGDQVRVELTGASVLRRRIDFALVGAPARRAAASPGRDRSRKKRRQHEPARPRNVAPKGRKGKGRAGRRGRGKS